MCTGSIPERSALPLHDLPPSPGNLRIVVIDESLTLRVRERCMLDSCAGVSARVVSTVSMVEPS
jgi:hypothetical protein